MVEAFKLNLPLPTIVMIIKIYSDYIHAGFPYKHLYVKHTGHETHD